MKLCWYGELNWAVRVRLLGYSYFSRRRVLPLPIGRAPGTM